MYCGFSYKKYYSHTPENIKEIRYLRTHIDFDKVHGKISNSRTLTRIRHDGSVIRRFYPAGCLECDSEKIIKRLPNDVEKFYKEIDECIIRADGIEEFVDDSEEILRIFYFSGKIETYSRGLGVWNKGKEIYIGEIVNRFLKECFPVEYRHW